MATAGRKYLFVDFSEYGVPLIMQNDGTVASASDTEVNCWRLKDHWFEIYNAAQNDDIIPTMNASGWVLPNDNTDNDGLEMTNGINTTRQPIQFKVGTSPAFFFRVKWTIPDVSDYDIACVGLRKVEAYATTGNLDTPAELITRYTDLAGLNVNAGAIYTVTRLNSGVGVLTDTTDTTTDGTSHELKILVSSAGVVTFLIDGAAPTINTNTLTFDSTDLIIPFVRVCKGNNAADTPPIIEEWEVGYQ